MCVYSRVLTQAPPPRGCADPAVRGRAERSRIQEGAQTPRYKQCRVLVQGEWGGRGGKVSGG